ncbi:hypothetical protein BT69DRAFT_1353615 [Atractiella rhizophila]|nr:hypothetical protein BT69DRAFT_1353615 [Atractiella rhizophila]
MITVFSLNWSYFDGEFSANFVHAFRRHWFTSWSFTHAHLPLVSSLILASSGLKVLVVEGESSSGVRWYYGGSLSVALLSMTIIGALHRSLDAAGSSLLTREVRIVIRLAVVVAFALFPLLNISNISFLGLYTVVAFALFPLLNISNISFLGLYTAVSTALVIVECYGRLKYEVVSGPPVDMDEPVEFVDNVRDAEEEAIVNPT